MRIFSWVLSAFFSILVIVGCGDDAISDVNNDNPITPTKFSIKGFAQKGQLVKGSHVTAFALDEELIATGESFPATIIDNMGSFEINGYSQAPFMEIRAEGYFYSENLGHVASDPTFLDAIIENGTSEANINILTTLIKPRIKKLITSGKSYYEARQQAQTEIFKSFGIDSLNMDFITMDITKSRSADAFLMALACMVQEERNEAEVVSFLQSAANELEKNGNLSENTIKEFQEGIEQINPFEIVSDMLDYYEKQGLEFSAFPAFYKFLGKRFDKEFMIKEIQPRYTPISVSKSDSISATYIIFSDYKLQISLDSPQKMTSLNVQNLGNIYQVKLGIPANRTEENIHTKLCFKSQDGELLDSIEHVQEWNYQTLKLHIDRGDTRSPLGASADSYASFNMGDSIEVNGKNYLIEYGTPWEAQVKVSPSENYNICYPCGSVEFTDEYSRLDVNIPSYIDEEVLIPHYAVLRNPYYGYDNPYPADVVLTPAGALICVSIPNSNPNDVDYLEIFNDNGNAPIAGTYQFLADNNSSIEDLTIDDSIIPGKEYSIKIKNNDVIKDNTYKFILAPGEYTLSIDIHTFNNEDPVRKKSKNPIKIEAGKAYRISLNI